MSDTVELGDAEIREVVDLGEDVYAFEAYVDGRWINAARVRVRIFERSTFERVVEEARQLVRSGACLSMREAMTRASARARGEERFL